MTSVLEFEVRLQGAEKEALALRRDLRDTLLNGGAVQADEVDVDHPAPGRRSAALEIVGLVVSFVGSLAAAIQVMQGWQRKKSNKAEVDTTLVVTVDNVTVTLSEVPTPEEFDALQKLLTERAGQDDHEQ